MAVHNKIFWDVQPGSHIRQCCIYLKLHLLSLKDIYKFMLHYNILPCDNQHIPFTFLLKCGRTSCQFEIHSAIDKF